MSNESTSRLPHVLGWRFVSLLYDFFPAAALWFVGGVVSLALHRGQEIRSGTVAGWLEFAFLLGVTGLYATLSWRRGGQTIGMKPWRIYVTDAEGLRYAPMSKLWLRFGVGMVSLLFVGLGFWWALWDRDGLTWHDRASGTRMRRLLDADPLGKG